MMAIDKKRIVLIVSGGVAAYKTLELVRLLLEYNFKVIPVMTAAAKKFITPLSLAVLSGHRVFSKLHDVDSEMDFGHIELSRSSDLVVVAPATANIIAKTANGIADDLATNILLASNKPILMSPAMNVKMWDNKATKRNFDQLSRDGVKFVGPNDGIMACGEFGYGRMAEPIEIMEAIKSELEIERDTPLLGKRALVTSGPTEEPIDPVRYISNRSSGIQGTAIAESLLERGAHVVFVTGPVTRGLPEGAEIFNVQTAAEMWKCVTQNGPYDVAICAAAVSDWQMEKVSDQKVKKDKVKSTLNLTLVKTPDILSELSNFNPRPKLIVGFAAETNRLEANAQEKLERKNCDWILANDVNLKNGVMGKKHTEIILISRNGKKVFPQMTKCEFAKLLVTDICAEFK